MQPSVIYCKNCGYVVRQYRGVPLPVDDEPLFRNLLQHARQHLRCPKCGCNKWIRKVARKV